MPTTNESSFVPNIIEVDRKSYLLKSIIINLPEIKIIHLYYNNILFKVI